MRLVMCSVLDTVAGVYSRPFCARSDAEAQRIFALTCQQDEMVARSPSDYRLYRLGTFDEEEGSLTGERPRQLMAGSPDLPVTAENGARTGLRGALKAALGGGK